MTFEERMDRLVERHEALAQSVEMHNAMLMRIEAGQHEHKVAIQHQREMLDGLLQAIDRLLRIADRHETRISSLETK